jgi:hypothetical protein
MQCADIVFNSTAKLLADDQCVNGTGVSAVEIGNIKETTTNTSSSPTASASTGAAGALKPVIGSGLLAALLAWGLL